MSDFMQKQVVLKTMDLAQEIGYSVSYVFDGEEMLTVVPWETLRTDIVDFAVGSDECQLTFSAGPGKTFVVFFEFDNHPSEMIYDHTDSLAADVVCERVATFFKGA